MLCLNMAFVLPNYKVKVRKVVMKPLLNQLITDQTNIFNTVNLDSCFKNLILRFRLLHSTNKALSKITMSDENSHNCLETTILNNLKLLKSYLDQSYCDTQALNINAVIRYVENHLSIYNQQIIDKYNSVSIVDLRQHIDNNKLQREQLTVLSQFEFYLHSNDELHHQKLELILSRLSSNTNKLEDIKNLILSLFSTGIYKAHLLNIKNFNEPEFISALTNVNNVINNSEDFDDLILKKNLDRLRFIKSQLKNSFWHPTVLSYLVFTNINLHNRFDDLINKECKEIKDDAANLILHGISYIPKLSNDQTIDLINVYKFVCKIHKLIKQEYKNNYSNLLKLTYLHKALKQALDYFKTKVSCRSSNFLSVVDGDNKSVEKGWIIVDTDENTTLPNTTLTPYLTNVFCSINLKSFEKDLDEEQLNNSITHIINTLNKRELNGKRQIIRLKHSDLILTSEEANILLGNNISNDPTTEIFILWARRSIAIYSQLQDAISFYKDKPNLLNFSLGIYGLENLVYYCYQAQDSIIAIDNHTRYINQYESSIMSGITHIKNKLKNTLEQFPTLYKLAYAA